MSASGAPHLHDDEDDDNEVFLDESDIIHEVPSDNEDLPDADDDSDPEHVGMSLLLILLNSNFNVFLMFPGLCMLSLCQICLLLLCMLYFHYCENQYFFSVY